MAPPVWTRMYAVTHDAKYLAYVDQHWWETSNLLYDPQRHLYYRDVTFLHKTNEKGNPIFWSRGNGWVMAGIARTLEYLPADFADRARYEQQLREMAAAVVPLQDAQSGLWHSDLLDAADYPQPETSGSALITMALAWGVNHGVLDRAAYTPVIAKGWRGLVGAGLRRWAAGKYSANRRRAGALSAVFELHLWGRRISAGRRRGGAVGRAQERA